MKTSGEKSDPLELPTAVGLAARTVAVVLAGGRGTRLDPLTRDTCKPALPFGGSYRCIDFSLSNCVNSGIRTIGVAMRHKPEALLAYLWTQWNSVAVGDSTLIQGWRAEERARRFGSSGTATAVYRNLASIRYGKDPLVLVLAGDHIYKMDYRPMLEAHRARHAAVTIGCVEMPIEDACQFGVLALSNDGRVERLVEKPGCFADIPGADGEHALASMGIYVFDAAVLGEILSFDAAQDASGHDLAANILPRLIQDGQSRVYSYMFRAAGGIAQPYWRDIGTLAAYWQAHMELLGPAPLLTLDDPTWAIGRTASAPRIVCDRESTADGGTIDNSIAPATCRIGGQVVRSVLCDSVRVARGAQITESVILPGAVIGAGSELRGVIVDAGFRVPEHTVIERLTENDPPPVLSRHQEQIRMVPIGTAAQNLDHASRH